VKIKIFTSGLSKNKIVVESQDFKKKNLKKFFEFIFTLGLSNQPYSSLILISVVATNSIWIKFQSTLKNTFVCVVRFPLQSIAIIS